MAATRRTTAPRESAATSREIRAAVKALTEAVQTMKSAIFGRWDEEKNEEVPGIQQQLTSIKVRLDASDRRMKWAFLGLGGLVFIGAASAVGVPTKEIAPAASAFWQYVASHSSLFAPVP